MTKSNRTCLAIDLVKIHKEEYGDLWQIKMLSNHFENGFITNHLEINSFFAEHGCHVTLSELTSRFYSIITEGELLFRSERSAKCVKVALESKFTTSLLHQKFNLVLGLDTFKNLKAQKLDQDWINMIREGVIYGNLN